MLENFQKNATEIAQRSLKRSAYVRKFRWIRKFSKSKPKVHG